MQFANFDGIIADICLRRVHSLMHAKTVVDRGDGGDWFSRSRRRFGRQGLFSCLRPPAMR